ncbi:hypothetical protein TWF679_008351 [Orbilia oligospora]|uniref:Uncharacterized protein n=1 Tax=Orbilia oligospora TaxID=2813651 RepID=A0A8H8V5H1_ORBOL|nr:hypothetical protein TWF679_008351 [Orbilia oligospora]
MQAMGSPLAEHRVSRLNRTIPAPPVLNISNIANITLQLKPPESSLEDPTPARTGLEAVSKHHEGGLGHDNRNNWSRNPVGRNYFYQEGGLYVKCPPARQVTPGIIALINQKPPPQFHGMKDSSVVFQIKRLRKELFPPGRSKPTIDNQEGIVSAHRNLCLRCGCDDDGRIISIDIGGKADKALRQSTRCQQTKAVLCREIWKCYCFATLYQPIYQGRPGSSLTRLELFTDILHRIPRSVYNHIHNRGWSWRPPAFLAEYPHQRIDPGPPVLEDSGEREGLLPEELAPVDLEPGDLSLAGDPSLAGDLAGDPSLAGDLAGDDLAENYEFSLNVAPSDEPPYYLSGPENEIPADDPGEGSSTGASRSYNSYAPDDPWFGWGYGYGYGFDYDGSNDFFPPNKRDLSIQDKITHNQES